MVVKAIPFRGNVAFPIIIDDGHHFDPQKVDKYYGNNESGDGGWYPIGMNQMWHNGIHLGCKKGTAVHSIGDGRIVAVRMGSNDVFKSEDYIYGSPRFVLIAHSINCITNPNEPDYNKWTANLKSFYSLYMHLSFDIDHFDDVPWFRSYQNYAKSGTSPSNTYAKINVKEHPKPGTKTKIGLYCRKSREFKPDNIICVLPLGAIVEITHKEGNWHKVNVPGYEVKDGWISASGNRLLTINDFHNQVQSLKDGICLKIDYPVQAGEIIGHCGNIAPPKYLSFDFSTDYGFHLELFSENNLIDTADQDAWPLAADDTDDDSICESGKIIQQMKKHSWLERIGFDASPFLDASDVKNYFKSNHEHHEKLRKLVTKNSSFWATDWSNVKNKNPDWLKKFEVSDNELNICNNYMWWKKCESLGVQLPARTGGNAIVFHYHPIALLEYVYSKLAPVPIFYVHRGGQDLVVAQPSDINIPAKEEVFVYERDRDDWYLGHGDTLQNCIGIANFGHPNLYEFLINPATAKGRPAAMTMIDRRIWAAIWHSEGGINGINSYDIAFLSCGPFQQTIGTADAKGEIQGALNYVKIKRLDLFDKYFGKFNIEVVDIAKENKIDKGHFKLNGTVCKSAAEKAEFRKFIWAYRCVKAIEDLEFLSLFLEYGFKRIDVIRDLTTTINGISVKLSDIYKTELALSLLLDAHINLPTLVSGNNGIWIKAFNKVLNINASTNISSLAITRENELDMIREIIELRNSSKMWGPESRAAVIVLCCENLNDALAQSLGYVDVEDIIIKAGGINENKKKQIRNLKYNFLKTTR